MRRKEGKEKKAQKSLFVKLGLGKYPPDLGQYQDGNFPFHRNRKLFTYSSRNASTKQVGPFEKKTTLESVERSNDDDDDEEVGDENDDDDDSEKKNIVNGKENYREHRQPDLRREVKTSFQQQKEGKEKKSNSKPSYIRLDFIQDPTDTGG